MKKDLQIESKTGRRLSAVFESPDTESSDDPELIAGGRGVVVFAHCFTCGKDIRAAREISRGVVGASWSMLRFDFTGLGESEGDFSEGNFAANVDDVVSVVEYARKWLELPVIVLGHSLGGAAALAAVARSDVPSAVATIGAPANPSHVKDLLQCGLDDVERDGRGDVMIAGRTFTIDRDFIRSLDSANMKQIVSGLNRPLLLFHAPGDRVVGVENAAELFGFARHPKSFVSLDRASHLLSERADARYVGQVLAAWVTRYAEQT